MPYIHKAKQQKQIRLLRLHRKNLLEQIKQIRRIIRLYQAQIRQHKRSILHINTIIHKSEQNLQDRSII